METKSCAVFMSLCLLGGCAESISIEKSREELVRSFDRTLTKSEKQDVITELEEHQDLEDEGSDESSVQ